MRANAGYRRDALAQARAAEPLHAAEEAQVLGAGEHRVERELLRHQPERGGLAPAQLLERRVIDA